MAVKELEPDEIDKKRLKRVFFLALGMGAVLLGMKFLMGGKVISQATFPGQEQVEGFGEDIYGKVLGLLGKKKISEEDVPTENTSKAGVDQSEITSNSGQVAGAVEEATKETIKKTVEKTAEEKVEEIIETIKKLPEEQVEKVKEEIMGEICEEICGGE